MMVTYDNLVDEIRALRLERDQADARLLLRLVEIERDHMDVIRGAGCTSFTQFYKDVVSPVRYEGFKAGLAKVGADEAVAIGSDATIQAGQLRAHPSRYTAAVRTWREAHQGCAPTMQTAKYLRMQVDGGVETPKAVRDQERRADELSRLRAENADLRAENKSLKMRVSQLEKQLSKAKGKQAA